MLPSLALQCGDVTVGQVHEIPRRIAVLILGEERGELYLREEQQIGTGLTGLIVVGQGPIGVFVDIVGHRHLRHRQSHIVSPSLSCEIYPYRSIVLYSNVISQYTPSENH